MTGGRRVLLSGVLTALALLAAYGWVRAFEVSLAAVAEVSSALEVRWLALVFLALTVQVALSAIRWAAIEIAIAGVRPSFTLGFVSGAIAMALGAVLPAPFMGVLCRSLATRIAGAGGRRGAISGALDQLCDLAICAWFAIPAGIAILIGDVGSFALFVLVAAVLGMALALALGRAAAVLARQRSAARFAWLVGLGRPRTVAVIYLASLLRAVNLVVMAVLIAQTSQAIAPAALAAAVPIVAVANALAMLPGAIGVSEWGFSAVLGRIGVAPGAIVAFLLANRVILTVLPMLLGAVVATGFGMRRWRIAGAPQRSAA